MFNPERRINFAVNITNGISLTSLDDSLMVMCLMSVSQTYLIRVGFKYITLSNKSLPNFVGRALLSLCVSSHNFFSQVKRMMCIKFCPVIQV